MIPIKKMKELDKKLYKLIDKRLNLRKSKSDFLSRC